MVGSGKVLGCFGFGPLDDEFGDFGPVDDGFDFFFRVGVVGLRVVDDAEEVVDLLEESGSGGGCFGGERVAKDELIAFQSLCHGDGCVEVVEHCGLGFLVERFQAVIGGAEVSFGVNVVLGDPGKGFLEPFDVGLGIFEGLAGEVVGFVVGHRDER